MDYTYFEYLLKQTGTTVYRVSKETGIAASTFTDWKNGRSSPKADKLKRIAAFFGVSLDELLGGEGASSERPAPRAGKLPIIGQIRAGSPIITEETLLGYECADVDDPEEYFYLKVCGDSMKNEQKKYHRTWPMTAGRRKTTGKFAFANERSDKKEGRA